MRPQSVAWQDRKDVGMRTPPVLVIVILLLSCNKTENPTDTAPTESASSDSELASSADKNVGTSANWELLSSGEGVSLALGSAGKPAIIRLFCPSAENTLKVNVPSLRPIGSDERLTIGTGKYAVTLVADTRGDLDLGGVSGIGAIPDNFASWFGGPVMINYGAQNSGPHIAPPQNLVKDFVTACNDRPAQVDISQRPAKSLNACNMQDGKLRRIVPRRAIGTEPFWGARIEGRCVQYSHIEDQKGTRVWTRYTQTREGEIWSGALNGQLFELRVRNDPSCSDGMSDTRYPMSVELKVAGELRQGCAEPA